MRSSSSNFKSLAYAVGPERDSGEGDTRFDCKNKGQEAATVTSRDPKAAPTMVWGLVGWAICRGATALG